MRVSIRGYKGQIYKLDTAATDLGGTCLKIEYHQVELIADDGTIITLRKVKPDEITADATTRHI